MWCLLMFCLFCAFTLAADIIKQQVPLFLPFVIISCNKFDVTWLRSKFKKLGVPFGKNLYSLVEFETMAWTILFSPSFSSCWAHHSVWFHNRTYDPVFTFGIGCWMVSLFPNIDINFKKNSVDNCLFLHSFSPWTCSPILSPLCFYTLAMSSTSVSLLPLLLIHLLDIGI